MTNDDLNINALLKDIEDIVVFVLKKIDLDNSRFAKGIKINWIDEAIVIDMPAYGKFINSGRKKNSRMPPIYAIINFIRHQKITSTDLSEESLAFAIAKSIAIKGIKARPFIEELARQSAKLVAEHLNLEINKLLTKTFN